MHGCVCVRVCVRTEVTKKFDHKLAEPNLLKYFHRYIVICTIYKIAAYNPNVITWSKLNSRVSKLFSYSRIP